MIFNQARSYPEMCHWAEHFKSALVLLLEAMREGEEGAVRALSLRILREVLKTEYKRMADYAEITTLRVLANFTNSDATVRVSVCILSLSLSHLSLYLSLTHCIISLYSISYLSLNLYLSLSLSCR